MAEAAVGATIQVLIENLVTISQEQISLVQHFKYDLESLRKTFSMVNGFLHDAEEKQVTNKAVKCWLGALEALAFDADNVVDEINYQLLSKKVGVSRNKTEKKKVQSFFSNNPITYRLKLGRRIREINKKLKSVNQQAIGFGLQTIVARAPAHGSDASWSMETDSFSEDPVTLGRVNDVSRIVEMLITASSADRKLSVLPIVGMGGLGKTTLARLVFGHANVKTRFETRVWVHVPRNFDVLVLLKRILTSMTTENVEHGNREALLKMLEKNFGTKKYLLVLDDIWNEDREKWDDFVKSFSGISSAIGNCMIITTRSEVVASIVETLPVHKLKGLSDDDCWSIIKAKAFRGEYNALEFEALGKSISKKCQGLPLGAKVVGGLLFGKSIDEWMSLEKNWLSDFGDENPISKILKLSIDNLSSSSLKKCFAYCSVFQNGCYPIDKEDLVELWMAEGMLENDKKRSNVNMETTGSKIFNLLLQNSLLQVSKRDDYGNVTHWNMHDLVHDLAWSNLCDYDNFKDGISQRRYIFGDELLSIPKGQERYVGTLFFDGKVSGIRFSNFEGLRTLSLTGDDIEDLPTSIRELKHLRYLYLSETRIKYLPYSIGELYHLQTIRVDDTNSNLKKLPDSLCYLISLRHLHISKDTELPPHIGKLTSLQTLPYFHVGSEKGRGISELGNMKKLKGKLEIDNLGKVRDKKEAASADLLGKPGIYDLRVVWDESREADEGNHESVLDGLQPHSNLKRLGICGFKGKSLPQWTSKMAVQLDGRRCWEGLDNLMEIRLEKCSEVEELPMLGHLLHLKSLYLCRLENVRSIGPSFYNIKDCCKSRTSNNGVVVVFGALERLELKYMPNLTEWAEVGLPPPNEVVVFPRLECLAIRGCSRLVKAPSHFTCLEELNIYNVESSLPLENICGMKLTSLTHLNISWVKGLLCLPDGLFSNNHNLSFLSIESCKKMRHLVPCFQGGGASLKALRIRNCVSLKELPDDLHSLNALEEFHIERCPSLESIPKGGVGGGQQQQQGFTSSLRKLWIRSCGGLTNLPVEMVESCSPTLEELELSILSSITNIPIVIGCLPRMPRLRKLGIVDVPKFSVELLDNNNNNSGYLSTNNSVKFFTMGASSWDDNVSFNQTADAMLLHFTSLRCLILRGKEHLDCLPEQLQLLNALEILYLWNYGVQTLPEWFGNLSSSLEILELFCCKKLRHLPSKQAMQRLSKLRYFDIHNCPLLLKERSDNDQPPQFVDSEWPKISHIATIKVDYRHHVQVFETVQQAHDVPFGSYFEIHCRWSLKSNSESSCTLNIKVGAHFKKWCVMQSKIKSGAINEYKKEVDMMLDLARSYIQSKTSTSDNTSSPSVVQENT